LGRIPWHRGSETLSAAPEVVAGFCVHETTTPVPVWILLLAALDAAVYLVSIQWAGWIAVVVADLADMHTDVTAIRLGLTTAQDR